MQTATTLSGSGSIREWQHPIQIAIHIILLSFPHSHYADRWPRGQRGVGSTHYATLYPHVQADVIAGLKAGEGEALGRIDKDWQVNGKFGVIQASI